MARAAERSAFSVSGGPRMMSFWPESGRARCGTWGGHRIIRPSLFADASVGARFEWRPLTDEYLVVLEQRHEVLRDAHLRLRDGG